MYEFKEILELEEKRLERIVSITKKRLGDTPDGTLRLSKSHNSTQFYHCTKERRNYIGKKEEILIQKLAQKTYDEKVLRCAQKRLAQIRKITKDYEMNEIENIYLQEHPERQKRIQPVEQTWEKFVECWGAETYKGKEITDEVPFILTEKGERVRSKSEKIIADYFYRRGIAYKYEHPLYLKGMGTIYPDFTLLSPTTREEIYWEHLGKMDDPIYVKNAIKRIQTYEKNDIYPGERLILTYETSQIVLDFLLLEKLVDRYLS